MFPTIGYKVIRNHRKILYKTYILSFLSDFPYCNCDLGSIQRQMQPNAWKESKSNAIDLPLHLHLSWKCICCISMQLDRGENYRSGYQCGLKVSVFVPIAIVFSIANAFVRRNCPLAARPYLQLDQLHFDLVKSSSWGRLACSWRSRFLKGPAFAGF